MIKSFRHKGLAEFFTTGSKKGIRPEQATRLADILFRLQYATDVQDMNFPGAGLHTLRGQRVGFWAVKVSGNWRIIFRFKDGHALEVDYLDYH